MEDKEKVNTDLDVNCLIKLSNMDECSYTKKELKAEPNDDGGSNSSFASLCNQEPNDEVKKEVDIDTSRSETSFCEQEPSQVDENDDISALLKPECILVEVNAKDANLQETINSRYSYNIKRKASKHPKEEQVKSTQIKIKLTNKSKPSSSPIKAKSLPNISQKQKHSKKRKRNPKTCEICGKIFYSLSLLKDHYNSHTGIKQFACVICDKAYTTKQGLSRHKRSHKDPMSFTCPDCGKTLSSKNSLVTHLRLHSGEKPYMCAICECQFIQQSALTNHISKCHNNTTLFKCEECDYSTPVETYFRMHRSYHEDKKNGRLFTCEICNESYTSRQKRNRHRRKHFNTPRKLCDYCGKSFKSDKTLKTHMYIHTGEKPFKCKDCGMCFRQDATLHRHRYLHKGVKPHCCDKCGRQFSHRTWFLKHICKELVIDEIVHREPQ